MEDTNKHILEDTDLQSEFFGKIFDWQNIPVAGEYFNTRFVGDDRELELGKGYVVPNDVSLNSWTNLKAGDTIYIKYQLSWWGHTKHICSWEIIVNDKCGGGGVHYQIQNLVEDVDTLADDCDVIDIFKEIDKRVVNGLSIKHTD